MALISDPRLVKAGEGMNYVKRASELADDAIDEPLHAAGPGAGESAVLAAMQGAILVGGGNYPGNELIIGSGEHALLCGCRSGTRRLAASDQLTLEWTRVYRHCYCAMMEDIGHWPARPAACRHAWSRGGGACKPRVGTQARSRDGRGLPAHAETLDRMGFGGSRLSACGCSLEARLSPSWMERQMFFKGASPIMAPGMVVFLNMILMDSGSAGR